MPKFEPPVYPDILTQENWKKNKGLVATISGATGIGPMMSEAEKFYYNIEWTKFDFYSLLRQIPEPDVKALDELLAVAEGQAGNIKRLEASVGRLYRNSIQVHKAYKASAVIPKSTTAHVQEVMNAAETFEGAMAPEAIKKILDKLYEEGKQYCEKARDAKLKSMESMRKLLGAATVAVKGITERADYVKFRDKYLSAIASEFGELFHIVPGIKNLHKAWLRTYKPIPSDNEVKDHVQLVTETLKSLTKTMNEAAK